MTPGDVHGEAFDERDVQIFAIGIVNPFVALAQGKSGRAIIEDLVQITGGRAFFRIRFMSWKTSVARSPLNSRTSICWAIARRMRPKTESGARSVSRSTYLEEYRVCQFVERVATLLKP